MPATPKSDCYAKHISGWFAVLKARRGQSSEMVIPLQ
jgi:hypothetical protein